MSALIITALVVLVFIVIYQIARASELASILKGEEKAEQQSFKIMSWIWVSFFFLGMIGVYKCHEYLMPMMLPKSASYEGENYDQMLLITVIITGFVFFATHILLFYFSFKYRSKPGHKAYFYAHNNKLELLWTTIPALVLIVLVVFGLKNWIAITSPAPAESLVVEVIGKQFNFIVRYPGPDGVFGEKNFRLINDANNPLGLDWNDPASKDDIIIEAGQINMIKDRPVKLVLGSRDVIHNVGLTNFRMKMDCVPGLTTTLWFTPSITTEEMKVITKNPEFVYEIACSEMCGKGHYSMKGSVVVQTAEEYDAWIKEQKSYYSIINESAAPAPTPAAPTTDSVSSTATVAQQ